VALRKEQATLLERHGLTLRDLYRTLDKPGANPMKMLQDGLDDAARRAYQVPKGADPISYLLALNEEMAAKEEAGLSVVGPGLPPSVSDPNTFVTEDCLRA